MGDVGMLEHPPQLAACIAERCELPNDAALLAMVEATDKLIVGVPRDVSHATMHMGVGYDGADLPFVRSAEWGAGSMLPTRIDITDVSRPCGRDGRPDAGSPPTPPATPAPETSRRRAATSAAARGG
eukprot:gene1712-13926_t